MRVPIQVKVTQMSKSKCIHRSDEPLVVLTRDDIEALVIDFGDTVSSANVMCMGNRSGHVVRVCVSANMTINCMLD